MARGKVKPDELCKLAAVRVRLTEAERAALDAAARAEGKTLSDLARERLGLGVELSAAPAGAGQAM